MLDITNPEVFAILQQSPEIFKALNSLHIVNELNNTLSFIIKEQNKAHDMTILIIYYYIIYTFFVVRLLLQRNI